MIFNLTSDADCLSFTTTKHCVQKIPIKIFVKNVNHKWKQQGLCFIGTSLCRRERGSRKLQIMKKKKMILKKTLREKN